MGRLVIKNLHKIYPNGVQVLKDVNIEAEEGEFVVLVGPSGCGKSTLLRMIAGLEEITSGEIYIADKIVNNLPPSERNIAMVFQDYALYPHMTVRENLEFGLKIKKVPKNIIEDRIQHACKMLDISPYLLRKPAQLSGGQRQRVAIGRAIVRNPSIFLFDEPLSNLDAKLRSQTRIELAELHQKMGNTAVYVTHDQVEAMTLAHRIVVLNKGRVQQIGTPLELYNTPQNKFVAGFIGSPSMNFFNGELVVENGCKIFKFIDKDNIQNLDITNFPTPKLLGKVILGLRPEALKILLPEDNDIPDLTCLTILSEPHGHESQLIADINKQKCTIRTSNLKRIAMLAQTAYGTKLNLLVDKTMMHWFDAQGDENERIKAE